MAKILIVDDAAFMRMMIKDILTKNGYEVVAEAANGVEAVELYKSHQPDLVTMDITMPEMDGIEAVKQIKAVNPAAKVIMCSAMGQQSMVMDAIKAGANDFIVKPFQADRVLEAVKKKGLILKYASNRLREDKEIGLAAMNVNKNCYEFLGPNLKKDEEILNIKNCT